MSPFLRIAAAALAVLFPAAPGRAGMGADQKREIEALVRDYKEIVPGALGFDALQAKVEAMRKCGETACG